MYKLECESILLYIRKNIQPPQQQTHQVVKIYAKHARPIVSLLHVFAACKVCNNIITLTATEDNERLSISTKVLEAELVHTLQELKELRRTPDGRRKALVQLALMRSRAYSE